MASSAAIGVFDSGLGGISVARQMRAELPHERIIYFGDSANAPYGIKTPDEVKKLSFAIVENFVKSGVKAVVIACNTATSAAVNDLRAYYDIPIVGMEPALKLACDLGKGESQRVIVAATELTLRERKFADLLQRFSKNHTIFSQPCPDLVRIVERGELNNRDIVFDALHKYFDDYDLSSIDSVVLGCTHFVFYRDYFREFCLRARILLMAMRARLIICVKYFVLAVFLRTILRKVRLRLLIQIPASACSNLLKDCASSFVYLRVVLYLRVVFISYPIITFAYWLKISVTNAAIQITSTRRSYLKR